jgi:tetratricopeptide (TPR) repeat protein
VSAALNHARHAAQSLLIAFGLLSSASALAQGTPAPAAAPAADADIDDTAQADLFFGLGNMTAALPLYERLAAQSPQNALFAERLSFCLLGQATLLPTGQARTDMLARAKKEAERARSLGDKSNLLQVVLDAVAHPETEKNRMEARMAAAETAFTKGDYDTALAAYQQIAATDPTSYEARLFAGDVYFLKGNPQLAGEWFQKAIDVNPNRETAYRYWGDVLAKAGQGEAALPKFIDAVVAEPYTRTAWMGLSQWAQRNGMALKPPRIEVPPAPTLDTKTAKKGDKKAGVTIHVGEEQLKNPDLAGVWLVYSATRATWRTDEFAKQFPKEKEYRHTLAEEALALRAAVMMVGELKIPEEKLDANLRTLIALDKAQMLEPYVLLTAPDEGIAEDYSTWRNANRDVLRTYVREHVLHPADAKK